MVIYWCIVLPERVGVAIAWILGLLLDVYTGALLGQNALGLSVIAYLTLRLHKQIRIFPPMQQSVLICVYLLLFQFFTLFYRNMKRSKLIIFIICRIIFVLQHINTQENKIKAI